MGTNYYLERKDKIPAEQPIHIGKSSAGWVFALHVYPDKGINTLEDWKRLWDDERFVIKTSCEGCSSISSATMLKVVTERTWNGSSDNLSRSEVDGHCIGHGEGSWEYFVGYFS